jgi:hypothetical protein
MVTDFKLRSDFYETPVGTFEYYAHAEEACKRCDFAPELCITHRVEMATIQSLLKAINAHCGKMAEEYDFSTYRVTGFIPEKYWNLVAFAVEGGSEGYYIHVGAITRQERQDDAPAYIDFGCAKTYSSDSAYAMAKEVSRFLSAAAWN